MKSAKARASIRSEDRCIIATVHKDYYEIITNLHNSNTVYLLKQSFIVRQIINVRVFDRLFSCEGLGI